jgi:hypothetical protein
VGLPRKIRGLRDAIPGGFVLGRIGKGKGPPTLVPFNSRGQIITGGGGSGGVGATKIANEFFAAKTMAINETLGQVIAPVAFTLLAALPGSYAKARVASVGTVVLTIFKNTTSIGTITFTASATGVFSFTADVSFAPGDFLRVTTGGTVDTALADTTIMLFGSF